MKPLSDLTADEAVDLIEREAANAGVEIPARPQLRATTLDMLRRDPRMIIPYVIASRERIAKEIEQRA